MPRRRTAIRAALAVAATVVALAAGSAAAAQAPPAETLPAPVTQLSPDGRSVTDGVRTLTVSQASDLDPAGTVVQVTGTGYDTFKGVYVAFCLIPPLDQQPTPCGGGATIEGTTGASHWISSNPPSYGQGLAVPYGPGGSFSVTMTVSSQIGHVDCQRVRCAIVTRNDHSRTTDRSQDLFVPVSFAAPAAVPVAPPPTEAPIAPPATPAPTTTLPPETTVAPETTAPPEGTVADDEDTTTTGPETELVAADRAVDEAGRGGGAGWIVGLVIAVVVAGGAGTLVVVRRRASAATSP